MMDLKKAKEYCESHYDNGGNGCMGCPVLWICNAYFEYYPLSSAINSVERVIEEIEKAEKENEK